MKTVIHIESFEITYLKILKDFIKKVAPHIRDGLMLTPLENWENVLHSYSFYTVEWYEDSDFLYYGHGADAGDTIIEMGKINIGEL